MVSVPTDIPVSELNSLIVVTFERVQVTLTDAVELPPVIAKNVPAVAVVEEGYIVFATQKRSGHPVDWDEKGDSERASWRYFLVRLRVLKYRLYIVGIVVVEEEEDWIGSVDR